MFPKNAKRKIGWNLPTWRGYRLEKRPSRHFQSVIGYRPSLSGVLAVLLFGWRLARMIRAASTRALNGLAGSWNACSSMVPCPVFGCRRVRQPSLARSRTGSPSLWPSRLPRTSCEYQPLGRFQKAAAIGCGYGCLFAKCFVGEQGIPTRTA